MTAAAGEGQIAAVRAVVDAEHHQRLADFATAINRLAAEAEEEARLAHQHGSSATLKAIAVGEALARAKAHVRHGEFEDWVLTNTCIKSKRTAQAYMQLARKVQELPGDEAQRIALLPVGQALKAIASRAEPAPVRRLEHRPRGYRPPSRVAADAVVRTIRSSVNALNASARLVDRGAEVKGRDLEVIRQRVNKVLALVDKLQAGAAGPEGTDTASELEVAA